MPIWILLASALLFALPSSAEPLFSPAWYEPSESDWLIDGKSRPAELRETGGHGLILDNGLIARAFVVSPNFATVDLINRSAGESMLRGVKPEARVSINGTEYAIGGLVGQPDLAYLNPAWLETMQSDPNAFQFSYYETGAPEARWPWSPRRHSEKRPFPPRGTVLHVYFDPPAEAGDDLRGVQAAVHYQLFDNLPVIAKWITVANRSDNPIRIDSATCEILAVNEEQTGNLHTESNYAFAGMETNHWGPDLEYTSQTDYLYQSPVLFSSRYPMGPGAVLAPGETFESFITYTMPMDGADRERRGLARRRMVRTLFPQVTENPIFMHVRQSDSESVRLAVDQCADVGFEMVILTFWSGFDIESQDPEYIRRFRSDVEYARERGIEIGGYTLMCASRNVGDENNCIDPVTGKPGSGFGQSACLASEWSDGYFRRVLDFIDATGMKVIETDGPYHGDVCASRTHAHHAGLEDSQFRQWQRCNGFYRECLSRGMYINTPDSYFYNGAQKMPMGYRETNWSLPRWRQILIARQNIFDGTWMKPPSLGWMFVPLTEYHGGGAAATLEPLSEHLEEYEWHLALNFGSGVIACYRGPRLYDAPETRAVVQKWVDFYKRHRDILTSDIIHVRRADHKSYDCILHVNPELPERGLAMVFNPLERPLKTRLRLPLYYTGLKDSASVRRGDGPAFRVELDREGNAEIPLEMAPRSIEWFVVEEG